jgi:hypothetical protein
MKRRLMLAASGSLLLLVSGIGRSSGAEPKGVLVGRVIADDGDFLAGARVQIRRVIPGDARGLKPPSDVPLTTVVTDREGRYRFEQSASEATHLKVRPVVPDYSSVGSVRRPLGEVVVREARFWFGVRLLPVGRRPSRRTPNAWRHVLGVVWFCW